MLVMKSDKYVSDEGILPCFRLIKGKTRESSIFYSLLEYEIDEKKCN